MTAVVLSKYLTVEVKANKIPSHDAATVTPTKWRCCKDITGFIHIDVNIIQEVFKNFSRTHYIFSRTYKEVQI